MDKVILYATKRNDRFLMLELDHKTGKICEDLQPIDKDKLNELWALAEDKGLSPMKLPSKNIVEAFVYEQDNEFKILSKDEAHSDSVHETVDNNGLLEMAIDLLLDRELHHTPAEELKAMLQKDSIENVRIECHVECTIRISLFDGNLQAYYTNLLDLSKQPLATLPNLKEINLN